MFHDIYEDSDHGDKYSVSIKRLSEILEWLENNHYVIVPLNKLKERLNDDQAGRICVITFDDGYKSVYKTVLPIFRQKRLPFTTYIISDRINQDGYLSEREIAELDKSGICNIGSHTASHRMTRYMTVKELQEEIYNSNRRIAEIINHEPVDFAFPYGSLYACSYSDISILKRMGYQTIATTMQRKILSINKHTQYWLPRIDGSREDLLEVLGS